MSSRGKGDKVSLSCRCGVVVADLSWVSLGVKCLGGKWGPTGYGHPSLRTFVGLGHSRMAG